MKINWRDLLLKYRRRCGLKQDALAADLGVSQATLSRWETGISTPRIAVQRKLLDNISGETKPFLSTPTLMSIGNWLCPAVAISDKGRFLGVSEPMSKILPQIDYDKHRVVLDDIFRGQVLEIQDMYVQTGFYDQKVECVEGCYHFEPREKHMAPFYFRVFSWPESNSDGTVYRVTQTQSISNQFAKEFFAKWGGPMKITYATAT